MGNPASVPDPEPDPDDGNNQEQAQRKIKPHATIKKKKNWKLLRPFFAWLAVGAIEKTFELTTQHARTPNAEVLTQHYKSQHPWAGVP